MLTDNLHNLRPYSWVDLFLLGFVAKFSVTGSLRFEAQDVLITIGLFFLWSFLNLGLEIRHGYSYRSRPSILLPVLCIIFAVLIGLYLNPYTIIFAISSVIFIAAYLLKNVGRTMGILSLPFRGLIQTSFFFYSLLFFTKTVTNLHLALGLAVLLMYSARALIGDMRDSKHNKEDGKKTFVVNYGIEASVVLAVLLFLSCVAIIIVYSNMLVVWPLLSFSIALCFYRNGYILHQSAIVVTSFTSVNLITYFTANELLFTNLVFTGLLLNMLFYPLLKRRSNPDFVQID